MAQIVIEVAELRPQRQGCDPGLARALAEAFDTMSAGSACIGRDVERQMEGRIRPARSLAEVPAATDKLSPSVATPSSRGLPVAVTPPSSRRVALRIKP